MNDPRPEIRVTRIRPVGCLFVQQLKTKSIMLILTPTIIDPQSI